MKITITIERDETAERATKKVNASLHIPKSGTPFTYRGIDFVILGEEQGGVLAITAQTIEGEFPFDKNRCNDWKKSSLRKYLNEEYIKNFDTSVLLRFSSDLTSDSGQKDYEISEDYIFLLSCDLYRKYREFMPKYNNWIWTLTPWHIYPSGARNVRTVYVDGSLNNHSANNSNGGAPACLFNQKIFQSTPIGGEK